MQRHSSEITITVSGFQSCCPILIRNSDSDATAVATVAGSTDQFHLVCYDFFFLVIMTAYLVEPISSIAISISLSPFAPYSGGLNVPCISR